MTKKKDNLSRTPSVLDVCVGAKGSDDGSTWEAVRRCLVTGFFPNTARLVPDFDAGSKANGKRRRGMKPAR